MLHDLIGNLRYFWRSSLAIAAGAAVATSVLAGALLVGDSVRESLRQLTLERLGGIDFALAGQRFFAEQSARDFAGELATTGGRAVPAILLRGTVQHASSRNRETEVGIQGVDRDFFALYADVETVEDPFAGPAAADPPSLFPPALIHQGLADALDAQEGDQLLISLQRTSEVPAGSLLARDDTQAVVALVRAVVHKILPDEGLGSFRLESNQGSTRNVFLPLAALQKALENEGKVNSLLVGSPSTRKETAEKQEAEGRRLTSLLGSRLSLDDLAIELPQGERFLVVQSRELLVRPALAEATNQAAAQLGAVSSELLTWLVNDLRFGDKRVPYSTVSALSLPPAAAFGQFENRDAQSPIPPDTESGIWLNSWLAAELGAQKGDRIQLSYFEVGPREELRERQREAVVADIVAMKGAGIDPLLTQEYPGISGTSHMSDWDPPFPIELTRIRPVDEEYWDLYRATPKAFLPLDLGQEWWRTRWGQVSAVRVAPPAGESVSAFTPRFAQALKRELDPAAFGLSFLPVKSLGLAASGGATDFGGLFFGLSFFVILAAALLVSLLMSLLVEQRSGEIGLRLALGFSQRRIRRGLLAEGAVLAVAGSGVGIGGALLYAWLMMLGLRTFWRPAVGTSRLELVPTPLALISGLVLALVITLITIFWTLRRVGRLPAPQLLRKSLSSEASTRAGKKVPWIASVGLLAALAFLVLGTTLTGSGAPFFLFLAGISCLAGSLAAFAYLVQRIQPALKPGAFSTWQLAFANTRRQHKRSLLATTLIALATFLIVLVAAFEVDFSDAAIDKQSGTGGFSLVAESSIPLQYDLGSTTGRAELGLEEELFANTQIFPARLLPGEDTSCLNLYQPTRPRLLGLPKDLVARGGFTFQQTSEKLDDPWQLLYRDEGPDVIPVIGDFNSTQWILKLPLGGELPFENERGEKIRLKLVASLQTSIFQSELLISEEQMARHFPSLGGYSYFLVEASPERVGELTQNLERGLERYGIDAESTPSRLAAFHAVQNTYLSTFRSLGGLGLLLGTLGLAIVLVRNVIERRGELAAMRAFGFDRRVLRRLILYENLLLLMAGLVIGTVSALVGAASQLLAHPSSIPIVAIFGTLALIALTGSLAAWLALRGAMASPLLPVLKAEQ